MEKKTYIPPGVGVGTMLIKDNKVLLGKRHDDPKKADSALHGEGTWTLPGGKVEHMQSAFQAANSEVKEETSITIKKEHTHVVMVASDSSKDVHFITIGFVCTGFQGTPAVMEPDEITRWEWFDLGNLPEPMYPPSKKLINKYLEQLKNHSTKTVFE